MKTAFVLLAAVGIVAAQDLTGIPACAQECIAAALPQVGCALNDAVCQCKDETKTKLTPLVAPCMTSKCTPAELQQALAASEKICAAVSASASAPPTTSAPATKTEATPSGTATVTDTDTDTETKTVKPSEPPKNTTATATTFEPGTTTTAKATTATSAVVTAGAAQLPIVAGAGLLAVLIGAVAGL